MSGGIDAANKLLQGLCGKIRSIIEMDRTTAVNLTKSVLQIPLVQGSKIGQKLEAATNAVKINAGVDHVKVSGYLRITGCYNPDAIYVYIRKNAINAKTVVVHNVTVYSWIMQIPEFILPVAESDTISVWAKMESYAQGQISDCNIIVETI